MSGNIGLVYVVNVVYNQSCDHGYTKFHEKPSSLSLLRLTDETTEVEN